VADGRSLRSLSPGTARGIEKATNQHVDRFIGLILIRNERPREPESSVGLFFDVLLAYASSARGDRSRAQRASRHHSGAGGWNTLLNDVHPLPQRYESAVLRYSFHFR
jgi:hypothetical protein